jgi:hypothetical protein
MAATTVAGVKSGMLPPVTQVKNVTMAQVVSTGTTALKGITDWYQTGASANASGVAGQALTYPVTGARVRVSQDAQLAYFDGRSAANNAVVIALVDRLWENSGLSATLTTAQTVNSAALPARDINGSSNGDGVMCAVEWSTGPGAGVPALSLSYTNQAGTSGRTATTTAVASLGNGAWEIFDLDAGDTGIRSIQSYTANATRTSGTFHLILFRIISMQNIGFIDNNNSTDFLSLGLPLIKTGAVLQTARIGLTAQSYFPNMTFMETLG